MPEAIRGQKNKCYGKSFKVLHKGEIMDVNSLEMLKGGMVMAGCPSLTSCGCYKAANGSCGNRNETKSQKPSTIEP